MKEISGKIIVAVAAFTLSLTTENTFAQDLPDTYLLEPGKKYKALRQNQLQ